MNLNSFQLIFILHWEISQFFVANKKFFLTSLSLVNVIRAFVFYEKSRVYICVLRAESF